MIPDYETLMLPLLKKVSDGKEYKVNDVTNRLADEFNLTDDERKELLPSGTRIFQTEWDGQEFTYKKGRFIKCA